MATSEVVDDTLAVSDECSEKYSSNFEQRFYDLISDNQINFMATTVHLSEWIKKTLSLFK